MSMIDDITSRISALEQMFPALGPSTSAADGSDGSDSVSSSGAPVTTTADGSAPLTVFDSELQSAMAAESDPADSTGQVEMPDPTTTATGTATAAIATAGGGVTGSAVVTDAEKYLGVPYVYGGTNPATGLDCSALVQRTYADLGITLPRTSQEQSTVGTAVASLAQAQPGDLLGFDGTPPTHTGIYIGNNQMVVAPHTGEQVQIQTVSTTPTTIRRILGTSADTTMTSTTMASAALVSRPAALGGLGSATVGALTSGQVTNPAGAVTYATQFAAAEQKYDLPSGLLSAVAHAESDYQPGAVSSAGAVGLMQLMPATAAALGVDPTDPHQSIDGAAKLLQGEIAKYNSVPLALAAYNAGGPAVDKYDGIPPYPQTQAYVHKIMGYLNGDA